MNHHPTPGEFLKEMFLEELGLSQRHLAQSIGVSPSGINDIVKGKRRIEPDMAIRLGRFFGTSAQYWLNLQNHHELRQLEGRGSYRHIEQYGTP